MEENKSLNDVTESLKKHVKSQEKFIKNSKQRDFEVESSVNKFNEKVSNSFNDVKSNITKSGDATALKELDASGISNIIDKLNEVTQESISDDLEDRKSSQRKLDILIDSLHNIELNDDRLIRLQSDLIEEATNTRNEIVNTQDVFKESFENFSDHLSFFSGILTAAVSNSPILTFMTSQAIKSVKDSLKVRKEKKRADAKFIKEMINSTKEIVASNEKLSLDQKEALGQTDDGIGEINAVMPEIDTSKDEDILMDFTKRLEEILSTNPDELSTEHLSDINVAISELPAHLQDSILKDMQKEFSETMKAGSQSILEKLDESGTGFDELKNTLDGHAIDLLSVMLNGQADIQEFLDAATVAQAKQDLIDEENRRDKIAAPNSIIPDTDDNEKDAKGLFGSLTESISTFLSVTAISLVGAFKSLATNSLRFVTSAFKRVLAPAIIFGNFFSELGTAIGELFAGRNFLDTLNEMGTNFLNDTLSFLSFGLFNAETFRGFFESMFGTIFDFAGNIPMWISDTFNTGISKLMSIDWMAPFNWIGDRFGNFIDMGSQAVDIAGDWLSDFGDSLANWFIDKIPDWVPDFLLPDSVVLQRAARNPDLYEFDDDTFGKRLDDPELERLRIQAEKMALQRALNDPEYKEDVFDDVFNTKQLQTLLNNRQRELEALQRVEAISNTPFIKTQQMQTLNMGTNNNLQMEIEKYLKDRDDAQNATVINQVSSKNVTNKSINQFRPPHNMDRSIGTYASAAHT